LVILAGVLYGSAVATPPGKAQTLSALASLLAFSWGMGLLFSASDSPKSKPSSTGPSTGRSLVPSTSPSTARSVARSTGQSGPVTFGSFNSSPNSSSNSDASAWCVGTKYAVAYEVDGVISELGPSTIVYKSLDKSDPIFTFDESPPQGVIIKWFRGVEPEYEMVPHAMGEELREGIRHYIDRNNPCNIPFKPAPPAEVRGGGGDFGTNREWKERSGAGQVPWCKRTIYYATYQQLDEPHAESDRVVSPAFQSMEYNVPCVQVDERPGFKINWYRQIVGVDPEPRLVGEGPQFFDYDNPCGIPNKPTAAPSWAGWNVDLRNLP